MPRLPVLGADDKVYNVLVAPENVERYAPMLIRNPRTNRRKTVYVRETGELLVRESDLDAEAREAAGVEPGNVKITVTASTEYTDTKPGNDALFIDASYTVVVPADKVEDARERVEAVLREAMERSGLPFDPDRVKIKWGTEVESAPGRDVGIAASHLRFGRRRDRMRGVYGRAEQQVLDAVTAAIGAAEARAAAPTLTEAKRRLTAKKDASGRWRDKRGRFSRPPASVMVLP